MLLGRLLALSLLLAAGPAMSSTAPAVGMARGIDWQSRWGDALFHKAQAEQRFVLLNLHAVWCHWCHVMEETTYADPRVRSLLAQRYVAVTVDADGDPELTARYGDWGWPATIVLAADGTEIVKRRGYIEPDQMVALLEAIIEDPSPGPSVVPAARITSGRNRSLGPSQRAALTQVYEVLYDREHGGWGEVHKFIDAPTLELTLARLDAGNATAATWARRTLDANLLLIDPVWGGVYQYSDEVDWKSPHYEKLLAFQADDLRLYAEAYARWSDPRYLEAARSLEQFLLGFLEAPDGGFYVSQDADLSAEVPGRVFYAREDAGRRALGMPRIDRHEYSRETGWAIRALCKYYDVTGDTQALAAAQSGARWALGKRALPAGAFRHDAHDRSGPFLDDQIALVQGFLALHRSTGERRWLAYATRALNWIETNLKDSQGGFDVTPQGREGRGVFRAPLRVAEQNAALVRAANRVAHLTGAPRYARMAAHGMAFLAAYAQVNPEELRADILLADTELAAAPVHITIVGTKDDAAAIALHAAALRYPAEYLQVDWWDKREGPLPNPAVTYPTLDRAAAFACSGSACSLPVFEGAEIEPAVKRILAP